MLDHSIQYVEIARPKVFIIGNSSKLASTKHWLYFSEVIKRLRDADYDVKYQVLNTRALGLPQNTQRTYVVATSK